VSPRPSDIARGTRTQVCCAAEGKVWTSRTHNEWLLWATARLSSSEGGDVGLMQGKCIFDFDKSGIAFDPYLCFQQQGRMFATREQDAALVHERRQLGDVVPPGARLRGLRGRATADEYLTDTSEVKLQGDPCFSADIEKSKAKSRLLLDELQSICYLPSTSICRSSKQYAGVRNAQDLSDPDEGRCVGEGSCQCIG
jgi:hypothetical protein